MNSKDNHLSNAVNEPDHCTPERSQPQINSKAKNAGLTLLKNVLFTIKTLKLLSLSEYSGYCLVSGLQT